MARSLMTLMYMVKVRTADVDVGLVFCGWRVRS